MAYFKLDQPKPVPGLPDWVGENLTNFPPVERWDDWVEYDSKAWPRKVERHYTLVPTICFNCEAACGLLGYVDKETFRLRKLEGNPAHPGSRGRNCAKGPATVSQVYDPERILYPLRRVGPRGGGEWERVSWDEVLEDISARMRRAIQDGRGEEIMYHVGRPGHDGTMERVVQTWGVDGHNSHTNVCSSSARLGYFLWMGSDRPSPDHTNARFILLLSSHLESGHYFNPQAQRIIEGKLKGAKLAVMDPRLSNTASRADYWMPTWPGSETWVLLAMARVILEEDLVNRDFVRRWVNWETYLREEHPGREVSFESFLETLREVYRDYTPQRAEEESGVPAQMIVEVARQIGRAGPAFATHIWRSAATGNLGGWQVARCLHFLSVLTGAVGTPGGTSPNDWNKFVPGPHSKPQPQRSWNELIWPREYPLTHYELSPILPHLIKEGRGRVDVYFTRVFNPVWTYPDGFTWLEVLKDEEKVGLHVALTPTWSETAWMADYVLPMGVGAERHDLMSQETQAGRWIGFRQPVMRVAMERAGKKVRYTYEANPGEVWEEDEFWISLSWRTDPDGSLGIRRHYESPYRPGEMITVEEYYRWIFENSVPGLPEAAAGERLTPLEYMRKYGAFEVPGGVYRLNEQELKPEELEGASVDPVTKVIRKNGQAIGVEVDGEPLRGWNTPSRRLEFYSPTMKEWGWPEHAIPAPIKSQVHPDNIDHAKGEYLLLSTFRLPTLIHSRSGNAKWLYEISHQNPVWLAPRDAERIGVTTGDLVRVSTRIGHFVDKVYVTEGIRPGVVACSHHLGRWRVKGTNGGERWSTAEVDIAQEGQGRWRLRKTADIAPWQSEDPDSQRVWWTESGVHQNLTFPVQPDPISGMHCWHQKVTVEKAHPEDQHGDVLVDTHKSMEVFREWLAMTRPPKPQQGRRPAWFKRPVKPAAQAYRL